MKNRVRHILAFCAAASVVGAAGFVRAAGTEVTPVTTLDAPTIYQTVELPAAPSVVELPSPPTRPIVVDVQPVAPVAKPVAKKPQVAARSAMRHDAPRRAAGLAIARPAPEPRAVASGVRPAILVADASAPPALVLRNIWMTVGTGF